MSRLLKVLLAACLFGGPEFLGAQLPSPNLTAISHPVLRAGSTEEVTLHGENLDELSGLHFSDPSISAEPIMLPGSEYRKFPAQDGTRFRITVPESTTPQTIEVRAAGFFGISTSLPILIVRKDQTLVRDGAGGAHHAIDSAPALERETLAIGSTDAKQVDWWKFSVKKGERLLIHCHAERIDSQADASLVVVDGRGYELERNRDTVGRDPMIDFIAPADGNYWIGVHDVFFNGGTGFPYVLEISSRPWIDAVFPPAGQPVLEHLRGV